MIVYESQKIRRLVGRLERGDRLPQAFEHLAHDREIDAGWIRALGAFEWVELCEYDQQTQKYKPAKRFDGGCEILSLVGNLSLKEGEPFAHVHATVSRERGEHVDVVGGHLVAGAVFACEFEIECFDDVALERARDEATGLALWLPEEEGLVGAGDTEVNGERPAPTAVTWSQVAIASEAQSAVDPSAAGASAVRSRRPPASRSAPMPGRPSPDPLPARRRMSEEEYLREPHPERGDYIDHRQFGVCKVEGDDRHGGLRIRLPTGVRKVIKLDVLQVLAPRQEEGRRVFPVQPRGRRS